MWPAVFVTLLFAELGNQQKTDHETALGGGAFLLCSYWISSRNSMLKILAEPPQNLSDFNFLGV